MTALNSYRKHRQVLTTSNDRVFGACRHHARH